MQPDPGWRCYLGANHVSYTTSWGHTFCRTCHPVPDDWDPPRLPVVDYVPDIGGGFAPRERGHKHVMMILAWTLEGPLRALMQCRYCSRTAIVKPSKRIRKIPEGFTEISWRKFLRKGEERDEALKAQEQRSREPNHRQATRTVAA